MKNFVITALMITICTLSFSCKKKDTVNPSAQAQNNGKVVFWTNNAAKFTACSSNILVHVTGSVLGSSFSVGDANITTLTASAPAGCIGSINNILPNVQYFYRLEACTNGGTLPPFVVFTVADGECKKIEIQ